MASLLSFVARVTQFNFISMYILLDAVSVLVYYLTESECISPRVSSINQKRHLRYYALNVDWQLKKDSDIKDKTISFLLAHP